MKVSVPAASDPGTRVIVPVEVSSFEEGFYRGVIAAVRQRDSVSVCFGDRARVLSETRAASRLELTGIGMLCSAREFALMTAAGDKRVPCVVWGDGAIENWELDPSRPLSICAVDNHAIGRMAAAHFLRSGVFRSFAYADSPAESARDWWARTRGRSFAETVGFAQCRRVTHLVVPELPRLSSLTLLMERVRALEGPVAVFACSDRVARNFLSLCREYALRVPADVAVLGVTDSSPLCCDFRLALSSVRVGAERMGERAVQLLAELQRNGGKGRKELLAPLEVVERESTRVRPTENYYVNAARAYIATAPLGELTCEAVIAHCGASKSYLTHRFRELTGKSILATIHDRFLNEIRERLLTSKLTIREIAEVYGIRCSTLCTMFKQTFGQTARQFRASHHAGKNRTLKQGGVSIHNGVRR